MGSSHHITRKEEEEGRGRRRKEVAFGNEERYRETEYMTREHVPYGPYSSTFSPIRPQMVEQWIECWGRRRRWGAGGTAPERM